MKKLLTLMLTVLMVVCTTTQIFAAPTYNLKVRAYNGGQANAYTYSDMHYDVTIEGLEPDSWLTVKNSDSYWVSGDTLYADSTGKVTFSKELELEYGYDQFVVQDLKSLNGTITYSVTQRANEGLHPGYALYKNNEYVPEYKISSNDIYERILTNSTYQTYYPVPYYEPQPNTALTVSNTIDLNSQDNCHIVVFDNLTKEVGHVWELKYNVGALNKYNESTNFSLRNPNNNYEEIFKNTKMDSDGWVTFYPVFVETVGAPLCLCANGQIIQDANYQDVYLSTSGGAKTGVSEYIEHPSIDVKVRKVWDDNNNAENKRPYSIGIDLIDKVDENTENLIKTEYLNQYYSIEGNSNVWEHVFKFLPKFRDVNNTIPMNYIATEKTIPYYTLTGIIGNMTDGFVLTNAHGSEYVDITGTKTWDDKGTNHRPLSGLITLRLHANGEEVASKQVSTADNQTYTFENMPRYDEYGVPIIYTITEDEILGYMPTYTKDSSNPYIINILNTHDCELTSVTVEKEWLDNDDLLGKRPSSITVQLIQVDGETETEMTGKTLELSAANDWEGVFVDLPYYKTDHSSNEHYSYKVKELGDFTGYIQDIKGNETEGYVLVNKLVKTDITVRKAWADNDNEKLERPNYVTVKLFADGVKVAEENLVEISNWEHVFKDMDMYKENGEEIVYTVEEGFILHYKPLIEGNIHSGFDIVNIYDPTVEPTNPPLGNKPSYKAPDTSVR